MSNKNYTLEKHLKYLSEEDSDYELLYSIWGLNKQNLCQGLNLISSAYPHYSKHDISHSMTIVDNIQRLLGEDRIKHLGATETFLILMACLTHDIGMVLTHNIIEKEWKKSSFKNTLSLFANSNDTIIANNAKILLELNDNNSVNEDNFEWALKVKNAVIILTAEILRDKHAQQSADYLLSNEDFKKLANNFYSEQLPHRFTELLADIALLHGDSFDNVLLRLHHRANGYKGDYIHPRFIACMIRLGDLLDFDDNRFNEFSLATLEDIPETSMVHKQKHNAVSHMLISPTKIEADLNCQDEDVYRAARSWFDWLEEEVNNQSREWPNITPSDLGGLPPIISKDSIRILYKGIETSPELLNLKFAMPQRKIFNILQGGGIYKNPGFAFIREIVQNAFDASKIQMWNDIKAGYYDTNINSDSFPDDIKSDIYKLYPINLRISWLDDNKDTLHIECEDKGIGISEAVLLRMTKCVGSSYQGDEGYAETYKDMPFWIRPTAAFGIGLQSIFFVTDKFEVETKYTGEKSKRIIFRSAADNQYCSIVKENIPIGRGTTIKVDIKKDKFPKLFRPHLNMDTLELMGDVESGSDDLYLAKIDNFVTRTFGRVNNLHFNYSTINSDREFQTGNVTNNTTKTPLKDDYSDYKLSYNYNGNSLVFSLYEKKVGSLFRVWFNNKIGIPARRNNDILLRDIIISNADIYDLKTQYLRYEWNLNNQTTDAIVDISRDNLTSEGLQSISKYLLDELLPKTIELVYDTFTKEIKAKNKDIQLQYLNYYLTALACGKNEIITKLPNISIPKDIVSYKRKDVKIGKLFNARSICLVNLRNRHWGDNDKTQNIENITKQHKDILGDNIVVWDDNYLDAALSPHFKCTEILVHNDECEILKLDKNTNDQDNNQITLIESCPEYLSILGRSYFPKNMRQTIYGLSKYPNLSVKQGAMFSMDSVPYSSHCIYSPFRNMEEVDELLKDVKKCESEDDKIKEFVAANIGKYITPNLIKIIKQHNVKPNVTEDEIKKDYVSLIYDYIKLKLSKQ